MKREVIITTHEQVIEIDWVESELTTIEFKGFILNMLDNDNTFIAESTDVFMLIPSRDILSIKFLS